MHIKSKIQKLQDIEKEKSFLEKEGIKNPELVCDAGSFRWILTM